MLLMMLLLTQSAPVLLLHAVHVLRASSNPKGGLAVRPALRASITPNHSVIASTLFDEASWILIPLHQNQCARLLRWLRLRGQL